MWCAKALTRFGKWGYYLHFFANGIDESEVKEGERIKSISRELTFEEDTNNLDFINKSIEEISEEVHEALINEGYLFKTISIKIRFKDFETHTKAKTLEYLSSDLEVIKKVSKDLLKKFNIRKMVRLIGVRVSNLEKIDEKQKTMMDFLPRQQ